jgi:putative peptidoglycan lipid II flippase
LLLGFLLWANGAFAWVQLRSDSVTRIGLLTMVLVASAVLYFVALWATGLKLRQFLRR